MKTLFVSLLTIISHDNVRVRATILIDMTNSICDVVYNFHGAFQRTVFFAQRLSGNGAKRQGPGETSSWMDNDLTKEEVGKNED